MRLKEKVCIISGGAVGVGRTFAEFLLREGALVRFYFSFCCMRWRKSFFLKSSLTVYAFFRYQFSTSTQIAANYACLNFNNNLESNGLYFVIVTWRIIASLRNHFKLQKILLAKLMSSSTMLKSKMTSFGSWKYNLFKFEINLNV